MNKLSLSPRGEALIKGFETLQLHPYHLSGEKYWTWGWGHNGPDVHPGRPIAEALAEALFRHDTMSAVQAVNQLVTVPLNQHQFDALVSFAFNCGNGAFHESSALALLNKGDYKDVPAHLKLYNKGSNGQVLGGLVRRRQEECDLFTMPARQV